MVVKKFFELLQGREFINVATADKKAKPCAAPKFFLKTHGKYIYLIDYTLARTVQNIRVNPQVSLCLMDLDSFNGYRVNGHAELIEKGKEFQQIIEDLDKRLIKLSAERVVRRITTGKKTPHFEMEISKRFVVIKVKVDDVAEFGPRGDLKQEKS